jgi:3-deoxy-D-manno-octulosonic acid kinase
VIDFDRGRLRAPGPWTLRNLARLKRSLQKIAAATPPDRFTPASWQYLLDGYQAV